MHLQKEHLSRLPSKGFTCTKVVADSLVMVSPTSFGCAMQLSMAGTQGAMSLLPLSLKAAARAVHAAFLTCKSNHLFGTKE